MRRNVSILPALVVAMSASFAPRAWAQDPPDRTKRAPAPRPAQGKAAQAPAPTPVDPKRLAELLVQWEQNSSGLKTLDVNMTRTDTVPGWPDDELYQGRAILKSPNLAMLHFKKEVEVVDPKTKQKKKELQDHEKIVCTGDEVWQYRVSTKQIFIYPLEKDAKQRALEEGPLPFLFNFKAAEAQKRYEMTLIGENARYFSIRIIPRLEIDKESFSTALVALDRQFFLLPTQIILISPDEKSRKDFRLHFTPQSTNCPVNMDNFKGQVVEGWKVVRNPGRDANPAPGAGQPAPARSGVGARTPTDNTAPAPQPATRPGLFGGRRN